MTEKNNDTQKLSMSQNAVPIVITETTVHSPRKIKRKRKFAGVRLGLTRLAYNVGIWAIERLEESFFDEEIEIEDPGSKTEKHFAIVVGSDGYGRVLEAIEVENKPLCIHHYEIIRHAADEQAKRDYINRGANPGTNQKAQELREPNENVLSRIRKSLMEVGHEDGYFVEKINGERQ